MPMLSSRRNADVFQSVGTPVCDVQNAEKKTGVSRVRLSVPADATVGTLIRFQLPGTAKSFEVKIPEGTEAGGFLDVQVQPSCACACAYVCACACGRDACACARARAFSHDTAPRQVTVASEPLAGSEVRLEVADEEATLNAEAHDY